ELRGVGDKRLEPGLLHRLDNDTSGLVAVARTQGAFNAFAAQFRAAEVDKIYLALVTGKPPPHGRIASAIAHDPRRSDRMVTAAPSVDGARPAETEFKVLEQGRGGALVEVRIRRGARHQIRVHLASLGH